MDSNKQLQTISDEGTPKLSSPIKAKLKVTASKAKLFVVGLLLGLLGGVGGVLLLQQPAPDPGPSPDPLPGPSVVFERVVEQSELVGASQDYCIVDKALDENKLFGFLKMPWTENSFWYRYQGTIKAGIDLSDAEFEQNGNTIYIALSAPYIISNTPDMEHSGVLEERNNVLNPIHVEDVDNFQRDCIKRSEEEAVNGTLLEEARENVRERIRVMFFAAYGDKYNIEFSEKIASEQEPVE